MTKQTEIRKKIVQVLQQGCAAGLTAVDSPARLRKLIFAKNLPCALVVTEGGQVDQEGPQDEGCVIQKMNLSVDLYLTGGDDLHDSLDSLMASARAAIESHPDLDLLVDAVYWQSWASDFGYMGELPLAWVELNYLIIYRD